METLLKGMRAAAEPTRLRILAACSRTELTVTDLTQILGQSQPRISRHLKLLVDAGLLDRNREGTWAYYRLSATGPWDELTNTLVALIPAHDTVLNNDLERLAEVKRARADWASAYFRRNAAQWDRVRSLHVDDADVEQALKAVLAPRKIHNLLDIGTGTGRILEVLGDIADKAVGVDLSHEMLAVARANLERAGQSNCQVRHGDMYHLPLADQLFDAVTIHLVLHYAEEPARVITEAARILQPGGQLVVVDFATHSEEELRIEHGHQRLGFDDHEFETWFRAAGLESGAPIQLAGTPLTVCLWPASRQETGSTQASAASERG
jgi:ArsR family transcriptional regulator